MPFLERQPGVHLYYETWGDRGPWLGLINGHTRASSDFKMLARRLQAEGLRIVSIDNRASGQSQSPFGFSLQDMAEDQLAVWQALGIERIHLAGLSMGGFIAQYLALHHQSLLRSLILISTAPDLSFLNLSSDQGWPRELEAIQAKLGNYLGAKFKEKNKPIWQAMAKGIQQAVEAGSFNEQAKAQRQALAGYSLKAHDLRLLKLPCLIIHGAEDAIIAPEAAELLQENISGAQLQLWPLAGHLLLAEKSQELFLALRDFVQEQQA